MIPQAGVSSSSSPTPLWTYDVFLSFRGTDTRTSFTDHLYAALTRRGIITFRDDEKLKKGSSIWELYNAVEESRCVIAILSSNYADSTWCMEELAKAVECRRVMGQILVPVFYHVHRSELRNQTGNFGKAFCKLEERAVKGNLEKVQRWRAALVEVADLSGFHLQDGSSNNPEYYTSAPRRISRTYTSGGFGMTTFSILSEDQEWKPCVDSWLPTQVFQRDLLDCRSYSMSSVCAQIEIPEWFSNIVTGDSIAIPIPPNLKDNKKWMGVAAVFLVKGRPSVSNSESDTEASDYLYRFTLGTHEFRLEPYLLDWKESCTYVRSSSDDFLCFFYESHMRFPKTLNESSSMWALLEAINPCMEVQKCGIRLVYKQDIAGFIQTFMLCFGGGQHEMNLQEVDKATFESGWFNLDNKYIFRWDFLSLKKGHHLSCGLLRADFYMDLYVLMKKIPYCHQIWGFTYHGAQFLERFILSNSSSMSCTLFQTDKPGAEVQYVHCSVIVTVCAFIAPRTSKHRFLRILTLPIHCFS
ncbi:unnamed protein product [Malus baccata var. baccata]